MDHKIKRLERPAMVIKTPPRTEALRAYQPLGVKSVQISSMGIWSLKEFERPPV